MHYIKGMESCLFCRVISGELPSETVYRDDSVVAFKDIAPQAPVHFLICPIRHIPTLNDVQPGDAELFAHMFQVARNLAEQAGIHEKGYRTVFNVNTEAGQTVYHLHLHLIGGRVLSWP
jgi:histidine triad (HIT) family protein